MYYILVQFKEINVIYKLTQYIYQQIYVTIWSRFISNRDYMKIQKNLIFLWKFYTKKCIVLNFKEWAGIIHVKYELYIYPLKICRQTLF